MKDYKKLYEDANKRVAARFGSDVARELFEDLYETENEKIRREIISALNMWYADESLIYYPLGEYTKKQAVAWLKKQGGQKTAWSEEDEKMIESALQFAHEYGRHGLWFWLKSLKDRI